MKTTASYPRLFNRYSFFLSLLVLLWCCSISAGWFFNISLLRSILSNESGMVLVVVSNIILAAILIYMFALLVNKKERDILASEEKYRVLVENAGQLIVVVQDGMLPYTNRKTSEVMGYSKEELSSRPFVEFIHPKDRAMVAERNRERSKGGNIPDSYPFRVVSKEGETKWLEIKAVIIEWNNRPATLNFFSDITERKKAEDALTANEARFHSLFDNMNEGVALHEIVFVNDKPVNYRIIEVNDSYVKILGLPHQKISGKLATEIYGTAAPPYFDEYLKVSATKIPFSFETYFAPLDKYFTISVAPWQESGFATIFMDITERKKAEQALKESEAKFRNYIDSAPDGLFIVDNNGHYIDVNKSACRTSGFSKEELTSMSIKDLVTEESLEDGLKHFKKLNETGAADFDIWHKCKDGSKVCFNVNAVRLSETKFLSFCKDITGRKLVEEENEIIQKKLVQSQKMAAVGQLASGVAHEINNPLTVILGFAQVELGKAGKNASLFESLKSIEREAQRCKKLVSDLLLFARDEKGIKRKADINYVIERALTLIEPLLKTRDYEIVRNFGLNIPELSMNTDRMQQVIINMISNAADAAPKSGKIIINTKLSGDKVQVDVIDDGTGMSEDVKKHIFEPFFSTKKTGQGTGLGLSLCYDIISKHNGTIDVFSEIGKGTTFSIKLPIEA